MRKKRTVPVLITGDVDPTPEVTVENKKKSLRRTLALFGEFGIKATFFCVARSAEQLGPEIEKIVQNGHEIGCHGLTHGFEEEYDKMPEVMQREYLQSATGILETLAGHQIVSFRGPRVKTSHVTQGILEELGYRADSSVCSQRVDFVSSNLINAGWIFAPRFPYHPHEASPYKRGDRKLWVVPLSAIVLPFVSGIAYTLGYNYSKALFDLLYRESIRTGKPIVYLFHPVEFAPNTEKVEKRFSFKNIAVEGFRFRRSSWLFEQDEKKKYEQNRALFAYMSSFPDVRLMTVREYVRTQDNDV